MKFTLKNKFVKQIIKEEVEGLKKDLLGLNKQSRLDEIRLKKDKIQNIVNEMYEDSEELEELFGMGKFSKAKKAYIEMRRDDVAQLTQAYKANDIAYVEISKKLLQSLNTDMSSLIKQFGFTDKNDIQTLKRTLMEVIQPMDYKTFASQSQKGVSFRDVAAGSTAGREQ
jgi:predicted mannosyl-3-phosphoglycerate phosphatase (HAD superfamily)|tara:strand:+ start:24177 stop:24683 length:507 start_codon:yes stop_codon:yes gene_type:complete